ncbi:ankyrin [Lophium mytilinum]|uniref:Ankyrin n=1 Tax=Lophium mytilinum TaxID=390894 RepID=A0A6A6QNR1_9PEZI|nr:ankyrin [Lophium mytilinum]
MPFAPRVSTTSPIPHMFRVQNPRLLRIFIKHGADLNWTTPEGENILHFAVKMMDHAMVKALLEMGMDADVGGNNNLFNPLHRAITGEDHDNSIEKRRMIVELLLEHGANPNIPSPSKEFALHKILAKFYGDSYKGLNRDHFDVLVARCQHINARDTQGKTALHILMEQRKRVRNNGSCLWYAKILIEAGADPSLVDSTGYPPFHSGIRKSKFGIGNFTITPEWRDLWWTPNDIYQRLHLATYYALKQGRVDWIPARVVYQQAYSEHVLKKCPAAYAWPALPHIRAETVQIFLDVMHALGSFPWRGGPAGVMFRAFWEKHREEITAPLPQSYQGNYNYRDWKETWAHWPAWNVEEWAKWREDQEWMRNDR